MGFRNSKLSQRSLLNREVNYRTEEDTMRAAATHPYSTLMLVIFGRDRN